MLLKAVISLSITAIAALSLIAIEYGTMQQADRLYREGKYDAVLQRYNNWLLGYRHPDIVSVNMGAALYKKGEYQKAVKLFRSMLSPAGDTSLAALVNYNMGNGMYRQGEQSETVNAEQAASFYQDAREYYRTAIRLVPADPDARYNLALTEIKLQNIANRARGEESQRQNSSGQDREDDSRKNMPAGDMRERNTQARDPAKASAPDNRLSGEKRRKSDRLAAIGKSMIKKETMSKGEAELLLEEYRRMEERLGRPVGNTTHGHHPEVEKEW